MAESATGNGGDLLVQILKDAGIETAYGIISVHNLPLVEAVDRELRFVPVRHEATAVNAADGYARATGKPGCAITSTGTGAGNAAGSLVESLSAGTSVLHITGNIESQFLGLGRGFIHETKDQLGMLTAVSKTAYTISSTGTAEQTLRRALADTVTLPGGPSSVEWPIDLQFASHEFDSRPLERPKLPAASDDDVARLLDLVANARRPLIWAGGGASRPGFAPGILTKLLELWGAGLLTSNSGRGVVREDHELCIGNYGNNSAGRELINEADLLLTLGTHFRSNETGDYTMPVPEMHIQVDLDPAAIGRVYPATHGIVADSDSVIRALLENGSRLSADTEWRERVTRTRTAARSAQRAALGKHVALPEAISAVIGENSCVARDVTIASSFWGNRFLPIFEPGTNIFPRGGGIGQGLGMALGAADGRPTEPTLCIAGDGGLAVHFGELHTLAQEKPWLVLMIFNDRGYGVLRNLQSGQDKPPQAVDLTTPDYAALSNALGLPYFRITSADEAESTLHRAVDLHGPAIVEVDLDAYGPMATPFTPPVTVPGEKRTTP